MLFYLAGHYTTAINIGILQGALPIFVLAGAFIAHGTRVTLMQVVGVLITSVGVLVIATRGAPLAILEIEFNRGDLLMLAACVLYAFYAVALRKRPQMPGPAFFTLLALIAAATSLPLIVFEALTAGLSMPTTKGLLVTAFVAIFPSCLAQLYFMRGVDLIGPGRAGVFMNLVPVFTAILAVWPARRAVRDVSPGRAGAGHLRHPAGAACAADDRQAVAHSVPLTSSSVAPRPAAAPGSARARCRPPRERRRDRASAARSPRW